jgi:hypothetical protein
MGVMAALEEPIDSEVPVPLHAETARTVAEAEPMAQRRDVAFMVSPRDVDKETASPPQSCRQERRLATSENDKPRSLP